MNTLISVDNLTYYYPQEKNPVLQDVSFKVNKGDVLGIIGPSGCGKSTLMLALSGLIPHALKGDMHGTITILGEDTKKSSMAKLSQIVQILFQSPDSQLFALNVEDEITFGLENLNLPWKLIERRLENTLNEVNIMSLRHRSIEELSSGQKQRVALAAILAMEPKILLFDEPTANLDQPSIERLGQIIKKLSKKHTIIIIEHNIEFLKNLANRVLLMNKGKIILEDKYDRIINRKEYKEIMLPPHNTKQVLQKLKTISFQTKKKPILEIRGLNFTYANKTKALSNVSLTIGNGDFLGIIGQNGSGKSTLALNIIGILKGSGKIILDGQDIAKKDVFERTKSIGYVFQNPNYQLFEEDLEKEIAFGPRNIGLSKTEIKKRVEEVLQIMHLTEFRKNDPHALSVGQKRRVSIASVLTMEPEIIIVDEPDTGLDHKTARAVMNYIKELNKAGKTIVMISHSLELLAEYCTRVIGVKDGRIVRPEEVYKEY